MSRYVDVEPLDVVGTKGVSKDYAEGMAYVLDLLDNLPIADVVEVRHGYWKISRPYFLRLDRRDSLFECSECGANRIRRTGEILNYCPNCGAKMDVEERKPFMINKECYLEPTVDKNGIPCMAIRKVKEQEHERSKNE